MARSSEELDRTSQDISAYGVEVLTISKDLFNRQEAFKLCDEIKERGIEIDVLVNNAGQEFTVFSRIPKLSENLIL